METDDESLRKFIIGRLVNHERTSDIIQEICENSGVHWSDAEALVQDVAAMYAQTIRRKRSPALVALAAVTFLGGLGLVAATFFVAVNVISFYRATQPEVLSTINILMLIANEASFALWLGALGLAMMFGSLLGMRDVWLDWLG